MATTGNHDRDLEQEPDPEFERIKDNYRATYHPTDATAANVPDNQAALEGLQTELQEFLEQYIPQVVALASRINGPTTSFPLTRSRTASSTMYHTAGPHSTAHHYEPSDAHGDPGDVLSEETYHLGPPPIRSRRASQEKNADTNRKKSVVDRHAATLQEFLHVHAENLRTLQLSLGSPSDQAPIWNRGQGQTLVEHGRPPADTLEDIDEFKHLEGLNQQFNMLVMISTFTAALIVSFIALIEQLIGDGNGKAFNAGMVFSFFALLLHLGNTVIAGRAAAITGRQMTTREMEYDLKYFTLYLVMCEQLQFLGAVFFAISLGIMVFLIFRSIAFPIVLLFFSVSGAVFVFWTTYWKVSITYKNVMFLIRNYRDFKGKTVERLRAAQTGEIPGGLHPTKEKKRRITVAV